MAKDILKEAIADAKAVREVALANAKAALEEAFTPRLQSMLSAKLSEELEEETLEETEGMEPKEEVEEVMEPMREEEEKEEEEEEEVSENYIDEGEDLDEEIDLEEILSELELEESEIAEGKKDDDLDEAKKDDDLDEAKDELDEEEKIEENRPHYKASDVIDTYANADEVNENKEFDLDALLEEIDNLDEKEEVNEISPSGRYGTPDVNLSAYKRYINMTPEELANHLKNAPGSKRTGAFQDVTADDIPEMMAKMRAELIGQGEKLGRSDTGKRLDKVDFDASAEGIEAAEAEAERKANSTWGKFKSKIKGAMGMSEEQIAMEEMKKELEETQAALEVKTSELNEVNLLNSKLLYVNRIFKANQLDDSQKLRVVETLDKADSVKEAKLIYETIKDTFSVANTKKVAKRTKTKSLKENFGMASKAAGTSTAPKKEVIAESDNMVNRFQKLANIKINQ